MSRRAEPLCLGCRRALRYLGPEQAGLAGVRIWSAVAYEGAARELVRGLKFRGAIALADAMAALVVANAPEEVLPRAVRSAGDDPAASPATGRLDQSGSGLVLAAPSGGVRPDRSGPGLVSAAPSAADRLDRSGPGLVSAAPSGGVRLDRSGPGLVSAALSAAGRPGRPPPALVPVPLHPARHRRRGFNQAAILAEAIATRVGIEVVDCLSRTGAPGSQVGRPRGARLSAPPGLIRANAAAPRRAVIVDDVATTGATLAACAEALRAARADDVRAVTFARTLGR